MRRNFCFMLKSFLGDVDYASRLIKSFNKYNRDNIHMYIVLPTEDIMEFKKISEYKNISLLDENKFRANLVYDHSIRNVRPGYINQAIIKLAFWESELCDNYFCIDSDSEFIKDFFLKDFMSNDNTPFSVLVEDKELQVDKVYYDIYWKGREASLNKIKEFIDFSDPRILTCHGNTTFNYNVLKSFKQNFLDKKSLTYKDIMIISGYEFSWYNFWLQKSKIIPIEIKEPFFKMFHIKEHHLNYLRMGIKLEDIARGYVGIIINSNYSRGYGLISYNTKNPYKKSLTHYLKAIYRRISNLKN